MRLDAVHAGARLKVPLAEQSLLRPRPARARVLLVHEERRYRATVPVERELQTLAVQLEHLQRVILTSGEQSVSHHVHARDRLLMPQVLQLNHTPQHLPVDFTRVLVLETAAVVVKTRQAARRSCSQMS